MIARAVLILAAGLLPSAALAWTKPPPDDACRAAQFEGAGFTLCQAAPGKQTLRLVDRGPDGKPLRSFARLKTLGGKASVAFAMNAGMFDAKGLPVGLLVIDGKQEKPLARGKGSGNFFLKPNGVFYEDATGWHVADTETYATDQHDGLRFATQSGPMLLVGGVLNPNITANGPSQKRRNGVCVDDRGVAWFAISEAPVSFGRFARLFRDRLACKNALYLDGTVSSLWDPAADRLDDRAPLGPIVVAEQSK
ncbi:hypothetical protein DMC47_38170 [Nostoc sp. 3335mG]|nr:hypothetical protein DMC47_38170 [Nostoc sp. 3335mG]